MVIAIVVIAVLNRLIIGRLHSIETKGVKRVSVSLVSLFFVGFMNFVTLLSNGLHYCGDIWRDIYYMTGVVVCVPLSYNFLAWLLILAVFLVTFLMFIRSIEIVANPEFVKRPSLFQMVAVVIMFVLVFALVLFDMYLLKYDVCREYSFALQSHQLILSDPPKGCNFVGFDF